MSYDLWLTSKECPTCGQTPSASLEHDSPTYNYAPMIAKADRLMGGEGCTFDAIEGKTGAEAGAWFAMIRRALDLHDAALRPLEPPNGWGTMDGLKACFDEYIERSRENPKGMWSQSGASRRGVRCCAGWTTPASFP